MNNDLHFSSDIQTWKTPKELYDKLNVIFNFNIDLAASDGDLCSNYYNEETDSLKQNWNGLVGYLNPPYQRATKTKAGQIDFVKKASEITSGTVVCLLPVRSDSKQWADIIFKKATNICFIKGRIKFVGASSSAPFSSAIVVFGECNENQAKQLEQFGKTI